MMSEDLAAERVFNPHGPAVANDALNSNNSVAALVGGGAANSSSSDDDDDDSSSEYIDRILVGCCLTATLFHIHEYVLRRRPLLMLSFFARLTFAQQGAVSKDFFIFFPFFHCCCTYKSNTFNLSVPAAFRCGHGDPLPPLRIGKRHSLPRSGHIKVRIHRICSSKILEKK